MKTRVINDLVDIEAFESSKLDAAGDFRDWSAMDAWATEIGSHLRLKEKTDR